MLVGDRMKSPVITVQENMPIVDALKLMRNEQIRRTPVIRDGKLVGIISDKDILNASPSPVTTLSIWEMNYLISKITVRDVMTKNVLTVNEDTPIEEAARIMKDNKIGGLPVMRKEMMVGIITETDLFKIFLEMMGARERGVRVTCLVPNKPGVLAKVTKVVFETGGNFIAFGVFSGIDPLTSMVTFKAEAIDQEQLQQVIEPIVDKIVDIRTI